MKSDQEIVDRLARIEQMLAMLLNQPVKVEPEIKSDYRRRVDAAKAEYQAKLARRAA